MLLSPRDPSGYAIASAYHLRPLNPRRISRLRIAWFILGIACGVALTSLKNMWQPHNAEVSAAPPPPVARISAPAPVPAAPVLPPQQAAQAATLPPQPQVATVIAPPQPSLHLPATLDLHLSRHETLASLLADKGVTREQANAIAEALGDKFSPKRITRGLPLTLRLDRHPSLPDKASVASIAIEESALKTLMIERQNSGKFLTREVASPIYKGLSHIGGTIHGSLYQTAIDSGIPVRMVGEMIQAFSYDVDFQRDIHRGDKLDVVFENTHTDKNVVVSTGKMLYASLTLDGKKYTVYRHTVDGVTNYYNAKGESVRKALLRTPINGARVTSGFGMRMHPLLGYSKMHKGVDFGAPTGTPIYAAGDGVVEEAGHKGGYGNYVRLRHNKTYCTAYGHASRIARGIRPGAHVRQGQIIAYVGSTGQSTGPHLHYEIIAGNTQVNPSGVKFRTGDRLTGKVLIAFRKQVKQVETALTSAPRTTKVAWAR